MDLQTLLLETIDRRSFSNIWYWLVVAAAWSMASYRVAGVPWHMAVRAHRKGGALQADVETLAAIHARRLQQISDEWGVWMAGLTATALSGLATLGFGYGLQFSQAMFLLGAPMISVWALSFRTARAIASATLHGSALFHKMRRHRVAVQSIGIVAIFVTALWGMYQNLVTSALGN